MEKHRIRPEVKNLQPSKLSSTAFNGLVKTTITIS